MNKKGSRATINLCYFVMVSVPFTFSISPFFLLDSNIGKLIYSFACPVIFLGSFLSVAGTISRFGLRAISPGKCERSLADPVYRVRSIYTAAWTFIFYCKPLYHLYLAVPAFKKLMLWLFGYTGNTNFVVYPDTWLRDLPVLQVGQGSYLSNKSSIATNICLMNNQLLVDKISLGQKVCIGHSCIIGPGTTADDGAELDASITSGIRVKYGTKAKIGEMCGIQHGVRIGTGTTIEATSVIGLRSVIGDNIRIKEGSHIHTGSKIRTQEDADALYSEETGALSRHAMSLFARQPNLSANVPKSIDGDVYENVSTIRSA